MIKSFGYMPGQKTSAASSGVNKEELPRPITKCCRRKYCQELAITLGRLEDRLELVIDPTVSLGEHKNLPALTGRVVQWTERHCGEILHSVHPVDGDCAVVGPGDRGEVGGRPVQTGGRGEGVLDQRPRLRAHVCRHQGNGGVGGSRFWITELVVEEVLEEWIA